MINPEYQSMLDKFIMFITVEKGLSKNTQSSYSTDLRYYLEYLCRKKLDVHAISSTDINEYLWERKSKDAVSASSVFRYLEAIKAFHRFLITETLTENNPLLDIEPIKLIHRIPFTLNREEIEDILLSTKKKNHRYNLTALRDRAILELLYASGLRVSEIISLNVEDVNYQTDMVRVWGKGKKERLALFGGMAKRAMLEYQDKIKGAPKDPLFINRSQKRFSRVGIWKLVKRYVNFAGITKHATPHTFRHSFATHMLEEGAELMMIKEMLGHSDIATTQIYTHVDRKQLKATHKKFHPREK